ncbi:TonB family protein [Lamprobacter modestohalophilus]|uniref:energy transducer TonB n=1 Tax=Lamprobacter modestohalophilus TaxID=1064514 RepID=UPI002ADEE214|nr:TonB family protein [Lamprobacter modestohalophilus]MEA1051428.1 TonB family protein [Lamprobacter modestohalophilus]
MTTAAAALRASSNTNPGPTLDGWSMPLAIALAIATHAALLIGLNIKPPQPSTRPTQSLELMVVTQSGLDSPAAVTALVAAQTDRAGETQALLPEVETIAAGAADSSDLNGTDVPSENVEPIIEPTTLPDPPEPSDPTPEQASEPVPRPADAAERPQPPAPAAQVAPPLEAIPANTATASQVTAASVDLDAAPEPETIQPTELLTTTQEGTELDLPQRSAISAADIFASRNAEMADLSARIEERSHAYASRTRRKAISTATREYLYANYMEAWRRKVERIGNLNYPAEARELGLFGSLILHVAVRADGSLEGIRVVRSSGHEVLDQAAIRIVELAAPFAPFPPNIKRETDVLDITRTWQFQRNNALGWGN